MSLDFSRDGKLLASGSRDGTAIVWSTETWKALQILQNPEYGSLPGQSGRGMVEGVAFSPDGMTLAMASREGNVYLWDVSGGKLLETLKGHSDAVNAVVFSPDGRTLALGGTDHTVRLWNVETRRQLMQLDPGSIELGLLLTLAFSPDGKQLLAGGTSGAAFWSPAPIVWNDPDRAAEKLRLLLQSNADSLPGNGPGRNAVGSFAQLSWNVTAASPDRKDPIALQFDNASADHQHVDYPIRADGHWNIYGGHGGNCTAVWSLSKPVSLAAGTTLTFQMQFHEWDGVGENLGRFRLSVSGDSAAFARFAAMQLTDPWARLAAAYYVIGDQAALDTLLKHHPQAAATVGDLYAAAHNWERAIAVYRKLVADQRPNVALLTKLAAAYQSAGRTREGVPYLAKASAANPKDTILSLQVAALQAWFGQEKELAATLQRIRAFAKDTNDAGTAERAAKACSIRASTNKAELEAALALARKGAELGKGSEWQKWPLLSLGMAEYRIGHYAAAIEAQLAAANAGAGNAIVTGISEFYRAMSLFRQGKNDEARKLASAAAAKMKPLPKDEQNPLANNASHDDLILWLAYKEAKAMIQFDAAPPPKPEKDYAREEAVMEGAGMNVPSYDGRTKVLTPQEMSRLRRL